MTTLELDLQLATECAELPSLAQFEQWVIAALAETRKRAELTIRIVDEQESAMLNRTYRGIDRPTNVLSFPFELPPGIAPDDSIADLLGDIVICAAVLEREAREQKKMLIAHWAHLVVHGVLHLRGFDHLDDSEAERMETLETRILRNLEFPSPYDDDSFNQNAQEHN
ncbi:rRNA maturation RNase YbeY [Chromatium weissei]|nr:rRNA maturation RNase YbeY [Chromatium weissei]